jgi:hypothetical protein
VREFIDETSMARPMICVNLRGSLIDGMVVVRHGIQSQIVAWRVKTTKFIKAQQTGNKSMDHFSRKVKRLRNDNVYMINSLRRYVYSRVFGFRFKRMEWQEHFDLFYKAFSD